MPYTNESRNLRQARPNKVGAVDLPRKNTLATPSMGFFYNNDYNTTKMPCQAFYCISLSIVEFTTHPSLGSLHFALATPSLTREGINAAFIS